MGCDWSASSRLPIPPLCTFHGPPVVPTVTLPPVTTPSHLPVHGGGVIQRGSTTLLSTSDRGPRVGRCVVVQRSKESRGQWGSGRQLGTRPFLGNLGGTGHSVTAGEPECNGDPVNRRFPTPVQNMKDFVPKWKFTPTTVTVCLVYNDR